MPPLSAEPPPPPEGGDSLSLRQLLLIVGRHWRLLGAVWAATVAAAAAYTFSSPRLYRPQAVLEIRPEMPLVASESNDPATMASRMLWENYYRTQESILKSPTLLDAVLKALPDALRRPYEAMEDPLRSFARAVEVEKSRSSFILTVGFVDRDPAKATQIVNTLVQLYLEEVNRQLREMKSGAAEMLSRETLPAIRQSVEDADRALQGFLGENGFIDPQEQYDALVESRRLVVKRITEIRLKQIQIRAGLETLRGYAADGTTGVFNPAFHGTKSLDLLVAQLETLEAEAARQSLELRDDHPLMLELRDQTRRVKERIREAILGTLKSMGSDLAAVEREETSALEEQGRIEKEMADTAQRVARSRRLEAELAAARELYNAYLKKHGETSATSGTRLASVRVVDHATTPLAPWKPNVPVNLALGAVLGVVLGLGAMFVTEQLNDRILSAKEVEAFVRLDVLSVIPRLAGSGGAKPLLLDERSSMPELESFRGLRAELVTRLEAVPGPKVVAVLSSMPSEGKSTVVLNLAKVLAMEGRRVAILDADMRRPSMQPEFGDPDAPGLEAVLEGGLAPEEAIRPSKVEGVDLLGMRKGSSRAAELASSPPFDRVFSALRERYEYVLVDSAPVNHVSEAAVIARRADAALLVVRDRQTGRGAALAAKRRLLGMGVELAGAVLNCAAPGQGGYGYGYGYGYYYGYGEKSASAD